MAQPSKLPPQLVPPPLPASGKKPESKDFQGTASRSEQEVVEQNCGEQGRQPEDPWDDDRWNDAWDRGSWAKDKFFDQPIQPLRLTEAERLVSSRRAMRDLLRTIVIQVVSSIAVAVLAFAVSGSAAGVSALMGAATYILPNALFAFMLILSVHKTGGTPPARFFLGQVLKIGIAALLLIATASLGREFLVWPAFLAGLVCALKSQLLTLAFGKKDI
jgi:ATP synthase protein I